MEKNGQLLALSCSERACQSPPIAFLNLIMISIMPIFSCGDEVVLFYFINKENLKECAHEGVAS